MGGWLYCTGDVFAHGRATAAQRRLPFPTFPPLRCPRGFHPGPRTGSACAPSRRLVQEVRWAPPQHSTSAQKRLGDAGPHGGHRHRAGAGDSPLLPPGEGSVCAPCILQLTFPRAHPTNNSTPGDPETLPETGLRVAVGAQKGEAGKKPRASVTVEKARAKGVF